MAIRLPSRCNHVQQFGPHAYALRLTSAGWRKPAGLRGRRAILIADRCALITMALRLPSRCNHAQQLGPHAYALRLTSAAWRKPAGLRGRRAILIAGRYALITMALRIPSRCNIASQFDPHAYALRLTSAPHAYALRLTMHRKLRHRRDWNLSDLIGSIPKQEVDDVAFVRLLPIQPIRCNWANV